MNLSTHSMLFAFFLCTIINIIGMVHFKNTKATIIGILWQILLIIQLTRYFIKKNHDENHDENHDDEKNNNKNDENSNFRWKLKNLHIIEDYTKPLLNYYKIPNVIFQTNETKIIPKDMYMAVKLLQDHGSECAYIYYDGEGSRKYIKKYYSEALEAYDKLIPGAFKADLFRYIRLYLEGGIYFDSSIIPSNLSIKLIGDIIKNTDEFVSVYDLDKESIYNAFMASAPRHPIVKKAIDMSIYNITNELYGANTLDITGPRLLGRAAKSIGLLEETETVRYFKLMPYVNGCVIIDRKTKEKLYYNRYKGYEKNREYFTKLSHYSKIYDNKKVYNKLINKKDIKIAILTWYNYENKDYVDMTYLLNQTYCKKYNIDCIKDDKIRLPNRKPAWEKFSLLLEYYKYDYDYLIWVDPNSFFYINSPDIRDLIRKYPDKDFIFSVDITANVKAAIIIIKINDYTEKIVEELSYNEDRYKKSKDFDYQQCIIDMIDDNFMNIKNRILLLPYGELEEFEEQNKAYVLHLTVETKDQLVKKIKNYI